MTVTDDFDQFDEAPATKAPARKTAAKRPPKKASSRIPANAKKPQDRKAPTQSGDKARRREADGVEVADIPITTRSGGSMVATIPVHQGDWSVRTVQFFTRNRQLDAIESLFGPEQWEAFIELNPTMNDLSEVGEVVSKELGMDGTGN